MNNNLKHNIKTFTTLVDNENAQRYWLTFDGVTADGGKIGVMLTAMTNKRWNDGRPTWFIESVEDVNGVQHGRFNPQVKRGGCGYVVRPERMLEATLENAIRLLDMTSALAFGTKRLSDAQVDMLATVVRRPGMRDAFGVDGRSMRAVRKLLDRGLIRMVPGEHSCDGLQAHMWLEPTAENLD